jgi:hypothetical protein
MDDDPTAARYRVLLAAELASCRFTEPEAALLCDACRGTRWEAHRVPWLWVEVADALDADDLAGAADVLAVKWQLAGHGRTDAEHFEARVRLISKLRALTPGQAYAVVDAVERFWADPHPLGERLHAVGLVRAAD